MELIGFMKISLLLYLVLQQIWPVYVAGTATSNSPGHNSELYRYVEEVVYLHANPEMH